MQSRTVCAGFWLFMKLWIRLRLDLASKECNINITRGIFQAWLRDSEFVKILDEADASCQEMLAGLTTPWPLW